MKWSGRSSSVSRSSCQLIHDWALLTEWNRDGLSTALQLSPRSIKYGCHGAPPPFARWSDRAISTRTAKRRSSERDVEEAVAGVLPGGRYWRRWTCCATLAADASYQRRATFMNSLHGSGRSGCMRSTARRQLSAGKCLNGRGSSSWLGSASRGWGAARWPGMRSGAQGGARWHVRRSQAQGGDGMLGVRAGIGLPVLDQRRQWRPQR